MWICLIDEEGRSTETYSKFSLIMQVICLGHLRPRRTKLSTSTYDHFHLINKPKPLGKSQISTVRLITIPAKQSTLRTTSRNAKLLS